MAQDQDLTATQPKGTGTVSIMDYAKLLTLLVSGCWALYQFIGYERYEREATLEQQRLSIRQGQLSFDTQKATQAATIQQQGLVAQQAQFTLDTQKAQQTLRDRELQYTLESERLSNEQKQFEIKAKNTYSAHDSAVIYAKKISPGIYEIDLAPEIKNTSETSFEVSMILVDIYVGKLDTAELDKAAKSQEAEALSSPIVDALWSFPLDDSDQSAEVPLFGPPGRWSGPHVFNGGIKWRRVGTTGSVYSQAQKHFGKPFVEELAAKELKLSHLNIDGSGTGLWKPGEVVAFSPQFLVRAEDSNYISFSVHLCFNRCARDEDLWWSSYTRSISDLIANGDNSQK
jgi:hypothetical protein